MSSLWDKIIKMDDLRKSIANSEARLAKIDAAEATATKIDAEEFKLENKPKWIKLTTKSALSGLELFDKEKSDKLFEERTEDWE